MQPVRKDLSPSEVRNFGWVTLGGFLVLGALFWYSGRTPATGWGWSGGGLHKGAVALWALGVVFAAICGLSPAAGLRLYIVWMTGAMYIGTVMTVVMLTLMFVVILPVFSLIRFSDPLRMKRKAAGTYWEDYQPHEATLDRMMRPF